MKRHCLLTFLALLTFFAGAVSAYADSAQDRMRERIPALDALRMAGKVGENNLGFLSARTDLSPPRLRPSSWRKTMIGAPSMPDSPGPPVRRWKRWVGNGALRIAGRRVQASGCKMQRANGTKRQP